MNQMTPLMAQETIAAMDVAALSVIVSRALAEPVQVTMWQVRPLGDIDFSTQVGSGGVYRVWGEAITRRGTCRSWSLVVKVLKSPAGVVMPNGFQITAEMANDQRMFGYWKREALAARSGLLDKLPAGLAAPRYVEICDQGDVVWLWQTEAVDDRVWTWADYGEAAYRLGLWQGEYVVGERPLGQQTLGQQMLPDRPYLTQNWMSQWVNLPLASMVEMVDTMNGWQHPLAQAYFAPEEIGQLQELWANRYAILADLAALPQTLCHLDAYRANLFWQGDTLTLIDWAFTGLGAVGEELTAFVGATLLLDHVPMADAEKLEAVALDGYLSGLRDAGWVGDEAQVAQVYRQAMSLRYALMSLISMLRTAVEPDFAASWEQQTGKPLADILQHRAEFVRFLLSRFYSSPPAMASTLARNMVM